MTKRILLLILLIGMASPLTGCITYPPQPPAHQVWINGHYSQSGEWIPGHWI